MNALQEARDFIGRAATLIQCATWLCHAREIT
jgi:hypothetical protein